MPNVVGTTLETAKSDIERAGYKKDLEVIGGGLLGILDDKNWEVCEQLPLAGSPITEQPRLTVERNCNSDMPSDIDKDDATSPEEEETLSIPEESRELEESDETPEPKKADDPIDEDAVKDSRIDANQIEEVFKEHLYNNFINDISEMCDSDFTHWACFYDGVESGPTYLRINLTTDGGWSNTALSELADDAGRHWFNFIGCDFPDLSTIVVSINGLDHNVDRSISGIASQC